MQEVFLEAWKSFHRFEPETNCRAWLFKILFHRLHHLRRRWIKASRLEAFASPADQDKIMADVPVPQEIQDDDILLALRKVPVEFREVVLMDVERIVTLALVAAGLAVAANLQAAENLRLNQKLDYSTDSQDGPLITGDHIQDGAVRGKPNYVFMFGEG